MFFRAKRSVQGEKTYEYLQLVESRRVGDQVRQHVLLNFGRLDQLRADGTVDDLLRSLAKFSEQLKVIEKVRTEGLEAHSARAWGPALVFSRLWEQQGVPEILSRLIRGRQFGFDFERVAFALALQRLSAPGSDLQGSQWVSTVECEGFDAIELQHMYRTVGVLGVLREDLERELFVRDRDLFTQTLDIVFIDTTSTFIYRDEETTLRRRGYSRDRMPDQPQVVICLAVDRRGWPIAWDILPGNTADKVAFVAMIDRMRKRFRIGRVVVVADRGMISKGTIELLEHPKNKKDAPFNFILGCKMRRQKEVSDEVLARAGRYQKVADNLDVKEVMVGDRRYVVCRNPIEARKDAAAREAIVAKLEEAIAQSPKSIVGNVGFKRFLRVHRSGLTIDRDAVDRDARLDGKFVLRTDTELGADEVAQQYKNLWRVERAFRETKATLEVRPVFHHRDDTTVGHIAGCFLALRLEVDLQHKLDQHGVAASWPDMMRDLTEVRAVSVTLDDKQYRLRTELRGCASAVFAATGIRPPRVCEALARV